MSVLLFVVVMTSACCRKTREEAPSPSASDSSILGSAESAPPANPSASVSSELQQDAGQEVRPLIVIAGGDIDLSRGTGQLILRNPQWDPFFDVRTWLKSADVRFANLESPLSDQRGETGSKDNPLVFTGPPGGAEVLTRGSFDIVSTANNHAWDYGKRGLCETLDNLDRVSIAHAGTSRTAEHPSGPTIVERLGRKLAFFAVTAIYNDGPANLPEPRKYIAPSSVDGLRAAIGGVRDSVDWVIVSVHIGQEYSDEPVPMYRKILQGIVDAGADVVLGHHTHTPQRVEFHRERPIVFSMGNFVFHQHSDHPWTGWGYMSRLTLEAGKPAGLELCPYHLLSSIPHPLSSAQEPAFLQHYKLISIGRSTGRLTKRSEDGCWRVEPNN